MTELKKNSVGWYFGDVGSQFFADQLIPRTRWYKVMRTVIARQRVKKMMSDQAIEALRQELSKV